MIDQPDTPGALSAFRHTAEISIQRQGGEETCVVKDAEHERYYRFGVAETFIIRLLDGNTDAARIIQEVKNTLALELDLETLRGFYESLWARGLLENCPVDPPSKSSPKSKIIGTALFLRFNLHNPDEQLTRLHQAIPWIFNARFHILSVALIILAGLIFLSNSQEIGRDFSNILTFGSIVPAWIMMLLATTCHEYAHGLTCKHYGGKVTEMGFILLLLQPGMYVNVSDSWLFPEKKERIMVMLAGMLFELLLWSIAIIVWRLTAPETVLSYISLLVLGTSGLRLFFNLNPLIKLDGYYVLSDWLEIPNLRQKAMSYLIDRVRNPFKQSGSELNQRHRRIFFWYGLFSSLFVIWIISFIASLVAGFLTQELQGTGFILLLGILVLLFKSPLAKLKTKLINKNNINATASSKEI